MWAKILNVGVTTWAFMIIPEAASFTEYLELPRRRILPLVLLLHSLPVGKNSNRHTGSFRERESTRVGFLDKARLGDQQCEEADIQSKWLLFLPCGDHLPWHDLKTKQKNTTDKKSSAVETTPSVGWSFYQDCFQSSFEVERYQQRCFKRKEIAAGTHHVWLMGKTCSSFWQTNKPVRIWIYKKSSIRCGFNGVVKNCFARKVVREEIVSTFGTRLTNSLWIGPKNVAWPPSTSTPLFVPLTDQSRKDSNLSTSLL